MVVVVVDVDACSAATFFNRVEIHLNQSLSLSNRRKLLFLLYVGALLGVWGIIPWL